MLDLAETSGNWSQVAVQEVTFVTPLGRFDRRRVTVPVSLQGAPTAVAMNLHVSTFRSGVAEKFGYMPAG